MKKQQKKPYDAPTMSIAWLSARFPLLAGSNTNDGYGEGVGPGSGGGWHAPAFDSDDELI